MTDDAAYPHVPVLLDRCVELLTVGIDAVRATGSVPCVLDLTLGMGGHSEGILASAPDVRVIGIDRDEHAIAIASRRLAGFEDRFTAVHADDDELPAVLESLGVGALAGALFDLGVSSLQLDDDERGFSYARDTALDMRMDRTNPLTAAEVLNTYPEAELRRILREYGEERQAARIARVVVADRVQRPWTSTAQLAEMLTRVIPEPAGKRKRSHPAKRTFQALRIEVNDELGILERALPAALDALAIGGVAVVESYQSLEDTIVKRVFRAGTTTQAPPDLPVVPESMKPWLEEIVRGAQKADTAEIEANPRAASVRLRAVAKTAERRS
ncbi:16S rRNA (cytosine(1402)-N(4))-methyltransferase RsmH [Brevibacterium sp. 50QC2O2]|uniref:16S rRNA (cytosine(1402)-N(4))-methyltransferase RsmH n=1 Tax=Brevibacterium TaxID=1696 RepID=UPI00211B74B7|nr:MULTISPECIES: 16S rRNA (cytosine(1402)-N(4))-methyltransferase RsmH [unclassified Brevibacterium]MCQ9367028.1 16S rRNA (cytosine(1402)-N(4))-methyltransferase RsmH [Brevibacterium sp. 91QC2O2]MCQ9384177.1 16S rRNA (cytosine(1402)-N(4))-methyltransferase RsmH [Brevibacterium sp. 68QC2CO]MCQ9388345.1 16S rRNA (cytosine(1402)-N(4))-methyltransferase RsmH [Brevibacterium sp. 50QC2O2]